MSVSIGFAGFVIRNYKGIRVSVISIISQKQKNEMVRNMIKHCTICTIVDRA